MRISILAVMASALALPALANPLKPVPVPEVAYPYTILGMKPGMSAADAEALMAERGIELVPEVMQLRATKPDGTMFDLSFDARLLTQGVGLNTRMGDKPFEEVTLRLDTGVLERRVMTINRQIRGAVADLPQYPELKQQFVELYGEPSLEKSDGGMGFSFYYAWVDGKQVADLEALPKVQIEEQYAGTNGRPLTKEVMPCFGGETDLTFKGREIRRPIGPGCSAILEVKYSAQASSTTINFTIRDFDLVRLNYEESMKQINEALNPSTPQEPPKASKMDL